MNNIDVASSFIYSLSHELRTPIHGIVGYTQLLSQSSLDKTQRSYLNSISSCSLQLINLVNNILDFSKLSTGKVKITKEYFSIKEVIDEINSTLSQKIKEKKQTIHYIIDDDVPKFLILDKQKVVQILINLISNSNKYTAPEGRILVNFGIEPIKSCHLSPAYTHSIAISIEDDGIGIPEKMTPNLFTPFFQVNSNFGKEGVGLGLVICKKLIELLGGSINIRSDTDKNTHGTIVSFSIPYETYNVTREEIQKSTEILKNKLILVVDDNVDNRIFLSDILFEYNSRPLVCSSGKEALSIISRKKYEFSLGIIDICMPDMSGIALSKKIKELEPDLPLLAFSSSDEPFDTSNFEKVISKPADKIKILNTLATVLSNSDVSSFQLNEDDSKRNSSSVDKIKILVVEDVQYNLEMLVKMLGNMNYKNIDTASDGEEAIQKLDTKEYDILLLDLKMPKVNGIQVAEHIFEKGTSVNASHKPKTIVLTGSVLESDKERCKELGIKYFLLKPVNMNQLKIIMSRLVNGSLSQFSSV